MSAHRLTVSIAIVAAAAACGLDVAGRASSSLGETPAEAGLPSEPATPEGSESTPRDAPDEVTEAGPSDGGTDAPSFKCGATWVASCVGCSAGTFACPSQGACVPSCDGCGAARVECVACTANGAVATAVCQVKSDAGDCAMPPLTRCACDAAADCPGARQVCAVGGCRACGESATHGLTCKQGKHCDDDGSGKPEDELTCH
jgi:hypothetical protein